jgi:hypothetical protein
MVGYHRAPPLLASVQKYHLNLGPEELDAAVPGRYAEAVSTSVYIHGTPGQVCLQPR